MARLAGATVGAEAVVEHKVPGVAGAMPPQEVAAAAEAAEEDAMATAGAAEVVVAMAGAVEQGGEAMAGAGEQEVVATAAATDQEVVATAGVTTGAATMAPANLKTAAMTRPTETQMFFNNRSVRPSAPCIHGRASQTGCIRPHALGPRHLLSLPTQMMTMVRR